MGAMMGSGELAEGASADAEPRPVAASSASSSRGLGGAGAGAGAEVDEVDVHVRAGGDDDVAALHALVKEAAGAQDALQYLRVTLESTAADFRAGAFSFLVAECGGEVAAVLIHYPLWDVCRCAEYVFIDDVSVAPRFRRRGLAARLVEDLRERGGMYGALAVDFQILRNNEPSLQLFRKLGAAFCDDFFNISLAGEALSRVASASGFACTAGGGRDVVVRRAEPRDGPQISELIQELAAYEGQADSVVAGPLPFDHDRGKESLSRIVVQSLVAEVCGGDDGGGLVGVVIFVPCYASWTGRCFVVSALVVRAKLRGSGIGSLLMQAVCRHATDDGVDMLQWSALPTSEAAMTFYQRRLGATVNATGEWVDGSLAVA
mmetsp:Transcript_7871/g.28787  ORF Transcript_7871/g.28787 Transcript_7871/m.28787 type:complete len:376 (+) Transcript_7871:104-1231(+)